MRTCALYRVAPSHFPVAWASRPRRTPFRVHASGAAPQQTIVAPEIPRVDATYVAERAAIFQVAKDSIVLDVREPEEVAQGRIRGSVNIVSGVFKSEDKAALDEAIRTKLGASREVVFHCHGSSVRGPTCAKILAERLQQLGVTDGPQVKVLAKGVAGFIERYAADPTLVDLPPQGWHPTHG